ncbi:MAG: glycosyltransferase [Planctomycetota bacterium]|nr:glycosyltransferase [Planctomycetota bacterium]
MRVVLLADRRFASRERSMLARLQVGLADEGIRVVLALPRGFERSDEGLFGQTVDFEETGLPLSLSWRASEVATRLRSTEKTGEDPARIVHVFGGSLWPFGLALAERLDAALILEVWRSGLVRQAQRLVSKASGRAGTLIVCADSAIAAQCVHDIPGVQVRHSPWGVYADKPLGEVFRPGAAWSVMIAGAGFDKGAFTACFEAIADIVREHPDMLVFADAVAARRADLWKLAEKLGVRSQVSLVDEMDANRDLVLRGDVLVLPEARGEQRTLVLEAMSVGMPVVAARDDFNTALIDERSALLVTPGDRQGWSRQLRRLFGEGGRRADSIEELIVSAHEFVATEHRPSRHVGGVIEAYEAAVGKPSIPFPGADTR